MAGWAKEMGSLGDGISPYLGQGEKGSGGAVTALSALAAALPRYEWSENSLRSLWEMPPWVIWCYSSHDLCTETSLLPPPKPFTGCQSSAWLLQVEEGKAHRPPLDWTGISVRVENLRIRVGFL